MSGDAINSCEGAINLFDNGDYHIQFTGKKSHHNSLGEYGSLAEFNEENIVWFSYVAPTSGDLTFRGTVDQDFLQMAVFKEEKNAVCEDIHNGVAEIQRLHKKKNNKSTGLDFKVEDGVLYALHLREGDHIMVAFATESEKKSELILQWLFTSEIEIEDETKVVDRRHDDFATTLSFKVYDKETNRPIISSLALEGIKGLTGLYTGSEFYFNLDRNVKLQVKCDAEGYFFYDSIYELSAFEDNEITIILDRIGAGKSMTIEEIEFIPGTSEVTNASIPNLLRLKDFMALNSDVNIEIQGHVFSTGKNTIAARKVSEARAKRVLKYLVDHGIERNRLSAVGYGNTKPLYEKPKFFYEEQANRRVEIMVK
jgi:outer membrane protein OmpA-like peptidoglycan-associated protein